ncbi:MAG: hypothetical protein WCS30_00090 [Selenomonadaceae bacterium]
MTPVAVMRHVKLELENLLKTYYLKTEEDDVDGFSIDSPPPVLLGQLPHKNFQPISIEKNGSYMLIGISKPINKSTGDDTYMVPIRVQIGITSQDEYRPEQSNTGYYSAADMGSYIDLWNILEYVSSKLNEAQNIDGKFAIDGDIEIGDYTDSMTTYPYSFGYVEFSLAVPNMNNGWR